MDVLKAFLLNIGLYSIFPLYLSTISSNLRAATLYCYAALILVVGVLAGAIYSFPLTEGLNISGGNLAYGAFMMTVVMLIITERKVSTFVNILRMVITVKLFIFLGFNFLSWVLESEFVLNPFQVNPEVFQVALWVLMLGGSLIVFEVLLLLFIFLQVRKFTTNPSTLAFIYTLVFFLVLCLDGVLFPLFAFGVSPDLVHIIFGNVLGKAVIAGCFSVPMLLFYLVFRRNFSRFIETPLAMSQLVGASRSKLLDTLHHYEARDQKFQQDNEKLSVLAEKDALTNLANRRKFDQILTAEWSRCVQEGRPLTVVIGDIDFFKQYNDTYGHAQGDACLKSVAEHWGKIANRAPDLAARVGGEEFALIFPNTHPDQILPKLQRFLLELQEQAIPHSASTVASHITLSMGVAGYVPQKGASQADLYAMADQRLYVAKRGGRNQFVAE
ncbi:GGDEF domain-containing protein [Leucothrix arctica]|uniref:diguanylate cyclase n=1 Tax=Leucothrix arctica TaxID=1481894 RepID=A0A317CF52_9GAMM|nr:GGDEF domain-containing protein [Leucothrix arctica]PWQ96003.1 GGDEF domain-containing protein [Leucothrix arctica]